VVLEVAVPHKDQLQEMLEEEILERMFLPKDLVVE
jgi:hypothetical protein